MKLSLPSLLLGLCVAVAVGGPAQAKSEKASSAASGSSASASKLRLKQRQVSLRNAGQTRKVAVQALLPARASFGQMQGLHADTDALDLKSSVALVIDQIGRASCRERV